MRFLADAGISPKSVDYLRRNGHDALHVREIGMQRAADRVLVEKARADDRIYLTFDLDFGEIFALGVIARPSVVIFRLRMAMPTTSRSWTITEGERHGQTQIRSSASRRSAR